VQKKAEPLKHYSYVSMFCEQFPDVHFPHGVDLYQQSHPSLNPMHGLLPDSSAAVGFPVC
jgi:hypothetical protein